MTLRKKKVVHGIPPYGITSAEKNSKHRPRVERSFLLLLEIGTCCSCRSFEKKTTINSQSYIETITALKRKIERTGIRNETLLHHDNARPHTGAATRDAIQLL